MTYEGETTRSSSLVMKILVVLFIAWVAYWAATGGLTEIPTPEESATAGVAALF